MGKIAFVYPGQGCQATGMGKELYDNYPEAREIFERASAALEMDIAELCFSGSMEELSLTENTQPTILTVSAALTQILKNRDITPDAIAGLSLGEYSALVAGDALSLEEAVSLVRTRGILMQEEVPAGVGGLMAVVGLTQEKIEQAIAPLQTKGNIFCSNFNTYDQIVIGGEIVLLEEAQMLLKEAGARMTTMLKVSAPFHTKMLTGAGEKLRTYLEGAKLRKPNADYYPNVLGAKLDWIESGSSITKIKDEREQMIHLLEEQVSNPVKWVQTIENMIADGVDTFVEVYPAKTVSSLIKKIDKEVKIVTLSNLDELQNFIEEQGGERWAV